MIRSNGFNGSMITSFERKAFCYSTSDQPSMYQQLAFSGMKANDGTDDRSSVERPSCIYGKDAVNVLRKTTFFVISYFVICVGDDKPQTGLMHNNSIKVQVFTLETSIAF